MASVVPALFGALERSGNEKGHSDGSAQRPAWLPQPAWYARQVVLLVLDGLGWNRLSVSTEVAPTLAEGEGGPITTVAPSTTATALTSITTGHPPARHGVLGYRLGMQSASGTSVMNVLRWCSGERDLRVEVPARSFQPSEPFGGRKVPCLTKSEFAATGFTAAHLSGVQLVGWSVPSTIPVEVGRLLGAGEPFVYAYYDGLDKVAHQMGLKEHFDAELRFVDRLVGDVIGVLPAGACLVVTADHGQVEVGPQVRVPGPGVMQCTRFISGEGRFRWYHARPGAEKDLLAAARDEHGAEAWVRERDEIIDDGWFGGTPSDEAVGRLGDVAVVARAPVAFLDPADTGELTLMARHGSLTPDEMLVPILAWAAQ